MPYYGRPWVSFIDDSLYSRQKRMRNRVLWAVINSEEIRIPGAKEAVIMYVVRLWAVVSTRASRYGAVVLTFFL